MTFDEAKLAVIAHGQEILGDLFKPCICVKPEMPEGIEVLGVLYSSDVQLLQLCRSCKARSILILSLAMVSDLQNAEQHSTTCFTSLVEGYCL